MQTYSKNLADKSQAERSAEKTKISQHDVEAYEKRSSKAGLTAVLLAGLVAFLFFGYMGATWVKNNWFLDLEEVTTSTDKGQVNEALASEAKSSELKAEPKFEKVAQ